ncbi:hypothetical protein BDR26DRAFT_118420 [Obelidium mucronatum]|nr:hypothetical protein BDR26DRAFT_118420 [Obelidium mucronatum]
MKLPTNATCILSLLMFATSTAATNTPSQAPIMNIAAVKNNPPCSYKADFPVGLADTEQLVKNHFDSFGLKYNIRTSINNQFANFVSFTVQERCGEL